MNRDLEIWSEAWLATGQRALNRWQPVIRWAFAQTGGRMPRRRSAALKLARFAIFAELATVRLRYVLRMPPSIKRGLG